MNKLLRAATIAALATAAPAFAQVGSLSDGSILNSQPQNTQRAAGDLEVSREAIGAWNLECAVEGPEPRPCRMHQLLQDDQGNPVAEVTMYRLPDGSPAAAGATFVVPLETLLTQPLTITLDGTLANRVPYAYCTPVGCIARLGISVIEAEAYKNGKNVGVAIVPALAPDQVVRVNMSLDGFKEAFEKATPVQN